MQGLQYYLRLHLVQLTQLPFIQKIITEGKVTNQQNMRNTIFSSGHQSSPCKGTCTDVIRIQTQNDICCFPSVTFEPLHYLLNFEFFTLIFAVFLSYAGVELLSVSLQGFNAECTNGKYHIYGYFVILLPILAKNWLPWQCPLDPCNQKCLLWIHRPRKRRYK